MTQMPPWLPQVEEERGHEDGETQTDDVEPAVPEPAKEAEAGIR
jgi:hypothetical protein